jgi:hypothetical protein
MGCVKTKTPAGRRRYVELTQFLTLGIMLQNGNGCQEQFCRRGKTRSLIGGYFTSQVSPACSNLFRSPGPRLAITAFT